MLATHTGASLSTTVLCETTSSALWSRDSSNRRGASLWCVTRGRWSPPVGYGRLLSVTVCYRVWHAGARRVVGGFRGRGEAHDALPRERSRSADHPAAWRERPAGRHRARVRRTPHTQDARPHRVHLRTASHSVHCSSRAPCGGYRDDDRLLLVAAKAQHTVLAFELAPPRRPARDAREGERERPPAPLNAAASASANVVKGMTLTSPSILTAE